MTARSSFVLLLALASCAWSPREGAIPPAPTRYVTDGERMLSESTRAELDARLAGFERASGHQVIVWIAATSRGLGPELFATRAFEAWKVGRAELDDGAVIFVFARERTVRIEVGYGLEGELTDADASRVIREHMAPRLRARDADGALSGGVDALLAELGGAPEQPAREPRASPVVRTAPSPARIVFWAIVGVLALILFITNPRLALLLLWSLSGGRGGFGGGGGGFSGGGGRSGGGGATGSW